VIEQYLPQMSRQVLVCGALFYRELKKRVRQNSDRPMDGSWLFLSWGVSIPYTWVKV